jgi:UDP-N-acetylmuramyl pentapeptide phosphotransferase/UDP-N-acetylglucosamine-1-phosphate transferase
MIGHIMLGWGAVPFGFLLIVWMSRLLGGTITGVAEGALVLAIGFVAYVIATGGQIIGEVLSLAVLVLCLVWMANLYNFMDGMDGFAGGMTVIGHGFLSVLAWQGGHQLIFVLSLLVAGAALGFLIWNFPPAKMFMGDAGSIPLGFLTGALALLGVHDRLFDAWVPLLIFSPFVVDATVTLIRRLLNGEKVWKAHRSHHYQRLVLAGWGHRRTVLAEYGLMLCCGGLALFYQYGTEEWRLVCLGVWCLVFVLAAVGVKRVEEQAVREQPAS